MRYHGLLQREYIILENIIREGFESGQLKGTGDLETSSKYIFFGVAMSIFNPTQSLKQNMPAEKAAEIIVDRYLYGEAMPGLL